MSEHTDESAGPDPEPDGVHRTAHGRHRVLKGFGLTVLVLLVILSLVAVYAYRKLNGNLVTGDYDDVFVEPRPTEEAVEGDPIDILVMGSDSREGDNNVDGLTGLGNRSDTTILIHLSADRKRAYGVSIPRDALVERPDCKDPETGEIIPGGTGEQWNAAFGVGGPGCTVSQFEQLSGIRVEYTVVVDFSGFKDIVDAVGGVTICVPETIHDDTTGITLEAGERVADGDEALDYVRLRTGKNEAGEDAVDGSDPGRIKRQQAFIAAMSKEIVSADTLANPKKLFDVLDAATKSIEITGADDLMDLAKLGYQFRGIGTDKIQFLTIPWKYTPDFLRVELLPEGADVWDRIAHDEPLTKEQLSDSLNAANAPGSGGGSGGTATPDPSSTPDPSGSPGPSSTPDPTSTPSSNLYGLCD